MNVTTFRNGYPTTALNVSAEVVGRIALAFRSGVIVRLNYVNLSGVLTQRDCYVKELKMELGYAVLEFRQGLSKQYRTVFFERMGVPGVVR